MKTLSVFLVIDVIIAIAVCLAFLKFCHSAPTPSTLAPLIHLGDSINKQVGKQDSVRARKDSVRVKEVIKWRTVRSQAEKFLRDSIARANAVKADSMLANVLQSSSAVIAADSSEITADTTEISSLKRLHRNDSTLQGAYAGQLKCARDSITGLKREVRKQKMLKWLFGAIGAGVGFEVRR